MTIPMNLPTLGSTGVVQNPGDIGALGNALSGLPAIIQANMQLEAQKQRDAQNQLYLQAQMDQMRFQQEEARRKAQEEQAVANAAGEFVGMITQPQPQAVGGGSTIGTLGQMFGDMQPLSPDQAIGNIDPSVRAGVLERTKDTVKRVETDKADRAVNRAIQLYATQPRTRESLQRAMRQAGPFASQFVAALPKDLLPPDGDLKINDKNEYVWIKPDGLPAGNTGIKAQPQKPLVQIGGPSGEGLDFGDASNLRKEYMGQITEHLKRSQAYSTIQSSTDSAQGDLSLIFAYMRMLDPGSTVREGEFATAEKTAGVPEQIRNLYNRVREGTRLGPEQRAGFKREAWQIVEAQRRNLASTADFYRTQATFYGVSPERIILDPYAMLKPPPGVMSPDDAIKRAQQLDKIPPGGRP